MSEDSLPPKSLPKEYNFPSLDLIFDLTKEAIAVQREQANTLDSKANFVLGSATALISANLVLQAALLASQSQPQSPRFTVSSFYCPLLSANTFLRLLPLLICLVAYLVTILAAFLAYMIRRFKYAPDPDELYKSYLHREERGTKAEVFRAMLEAYKENDKVIKSKLFWIRTALTALGCEIVALILVLLVQSTC